MMMVMNRDRKRKEWLAEKARLEGLRGTPHTLKLFPDKSVYDYGDTAEVEAILSCGNNIRIRAGEVFATITRRGRPDAFFAGELGPEELVPQSWTPKKKDDDGDDDDEGADEGHRRRLPFTSDPKSSSPSEDDEMKTIRRVKIPVPLSYIDHPTL